MYNLPSDASINDMIIYHEGNHTDKGNPHNNYISKYSCNYTINVKNNINKYTKIATIKYIPNANVEYAYTMELFSTKLSVGNKLILVCGNDLNKTTCKFIGDNRLEIGIKKYKDGNNHIIDIYVKIKEVWVKLFYRLYFARCLDYNIMYGEESAYKSITLLNEQDLIDPNDFENEVDVTYDRPLKCSTVTSLSAIMSANKNIILSLSIPNLTKSSYLISCIPINLPTDFCYGSISIKDEGKLLIEVKNLRNENLTLPKLEWNVVYK